MNDVAVPDTELLERAKELINEYVTREFGGGNGADFSDLRNVGLAYTLTEDGKHEVEASADLIGCEITYRLDGRVYNTDSFSGLEEMTRNALEELDWDWLTDVPETLLESLDAPAARPRGPRL